MGTGVLVQRGLLFRPRAREVPNLVPELSGVVSSHSFTALTKQIIILIFQQIILPHMHCPMKSLQPPHG